ncbi:hypothetical protein WN943_027111 [Citrus x changshan-huyou]
MSAEQHQMHPVCELEFNMMNHWVNMRDLTYWCLLQSALIAEAEVLVQKPPASYKALPVKGVCDFKCPLLHGAMVRPDKVKVGDYPERDPFEEDEI